MRRRFDGAVVGVALLGAWVLAAPGRVGAQTVERVTFEDAILRATTRSPTVQQAAAGIMRAEALLEQARSRARPALDASMAVNTIDPVTRFSGTSINPRVQTASAATLSASLLAPVAWAQRAQAADLVLVAQATAGDVRRQMAVATAQAYLAVIAQRRGLELNERARDAAKAHFDFASQRLAGGIGSRLNMLRAQQEFSGDEARVEDARLAVRRAQEALGVLAAADGPLDAASEPVFEASGDVAGENPSGPPAARFDLRLVAARQAAAERVVSDSWKDRLPSVTALFTPQILAPSGLFAPVRTLRASVIFSTLLFDGGARTAVARQRSALLDAVKAERAGVERQATSEVRTAREAVRLTERALERARAAAVQSNEVLTITDVAFREGATTNIEVIDAQRRARDADTIAALAEDALRRARLELLVALGRFPR